VVPLVARRTWRGWQTAVVPAPRHSIYTVLYGVSCATASSCVAVGQFNWAVGGGASGGLAEQLVNGHWKSTVLAQTPFGATYAAVSCPTSMYCVAVGSSSAASTIDRLVGTKWRAVTLPRSGFTELTAVSCPSRARGEAVSVTDDAGPPLAVVAITPGSAGPPAALEAPHSATSMELSGISCPRQQHCDPVGGDGDPAGAFGVVGSW
jgi:hypothetical protein